MALQPFDKHPANVGALETCGSNLVAQAAASFQNGEATKQAYQPAVTSWTGSCAPNVVAANQPVQTSSANASSSLAWAAVATQYWGSQVEAFNREVDVIVVPLHNPPAGQTAEQGQLVLQQARTQWWDAYDTYIESGGDRAAAMLKDGPTKKNVGIAQDAGVLPGSADTVWDDIWKSARGVVVPPSDQGWPGYTMWGIGKGGLGFGTGTDWWTKTQIGRFAPRNALGRFVSPGDLSWWQKAAAANKDASWIAKSGQAGSYAKWGTAAKYAKWGGTAVGFAAGAWSQWSTDEDNANLDTTEKVGRAAYRGTMTAAGAWVGAEFGGQLGAAVGTAICPGIGTVVGGVVGGIVGAVVGSGVANKVVDETIDLAGDVAEGAKNVVKDIGGAIGSLF